MLSIDFLSKNGQDSGSVDVSEDLFEWLAKSEYSKIGGGSIATQFQLDGEDVTLEVVVLTDETRKRFIEFFNEAIANETSAILERLGDRPSTQEYQEATYRVKTLCQLLDCVKNENYLYLQRV